MIYPAFNSIQIESTPGVSPVAGDTTLLAEWVKKLKPKHALEIGTGTGFVPIYLATIGIRCDGTDITSQAILCAKENAKRNTVSCTFFISDLFKEVHGKFDLVLFNPPFGNTSNETAAKYLELFKSLIPKQNNLAIWLSYFFIANQRKAIIHEFLEEGKRHITKEGSLVLFFYKDEKNMVSMYKTKELGIYKDFTLIQVFV